MTDSSKPLKIGVFDSGVGGKSIIKAIEDSLPNAEIVFKDDKENLPYGNKSPKELLALIKPILTKFIDEGIDVLVVACNTVTTTIIKEIRDFVDFPVVAVEPMIKPAAALSKTGVFTVCATPTTLASTRYSKLVNLFAPDKTIFTPDVSDWAQLIENDDLSDERLTHIVEESINRNSDVIVLACTHYHWIFDRLVAIADGRIKVIYPQDPVIEQLKRVVAQL